MTINTRLDKILQANQRFQQQITPSSLPKRAPEPLAVITCMDPRINLEAIGISTFAENGTGRSDVRIIRSIGGMAEPRSLIVGIFLAGIRELVVLMHTDCGCCLADRKIDVIVQNMEMRLDAAQLQSFKQMVFTDKEQTYTAALRSWLKTFSDPREALQSEVAAIRTLPFTPNDLIVHGLLYDVATGSVEVVVKGY